MIAMIEFKKTARFLWQKVIPKLLIVLLVAGVGLTIRYSYARHHILASIPDVGFPFPQELIEKIEIPDDENAYVSYRRAVGQFSRYPENLTEVGYDSTWDFEEALDDVVKNGWSDASRPIRDQLNKNRPAIETWLEGTKLDEARYLDPRESNLATRLDIDDSLRHLFEYCLIEASRLSHAGQPQQALEILKGCFRCSRHVGTYGAGISRIVGKDMFSRSRDALLLWSTNTEVNIQLLEVASK